MNSTQIRCFLEVAKSSSYIQAAEALFTTQPAVSYQINSLENELKVKLFNRSKRTVTLTSAGEYLYKEFLSLTDNLQNVIQKAKILHDMENRSVITLLIRRLVDYTIISNTIKCYSEQNPSTQIEILSQNDSSTKDLLLSNEIQLAFCYKYEIQDNPEFSFLPLIESGYYVFVSKNHHLAAYKSLRLKDLGGEHLLFANTELQKNANLINFAKLNQMNIKISPPYCTFDSMFLNVESGIGFTILPCSKKKQFSGLVKIPLEDFQDVSVGLAWIPERKNKTVQDFIQHAKYCAK